MVSIKSFTLTVLLSSIVLVLVAAPAAQATLSKADQGCRGSVAKGLTKLSATANKTIAGCHKGRYKGKIAAAVDCNVVSPASDPRGKVGKAAAKLVTLVAKKCPEAGARAVSGDLIDSYISCPEPCSTENSIANPLTSFSDLASCLACLGGGLAEDFSAPALGSPDPAAMSKDDVGCHAAITKGYGKYVATVVKDRAGCQKRQDKAGNADTEGCATSDAKGKIARALAKANAGVDARCATADLARVGSCASSSRSDLKVCLRLAADAVAADVFAAAYALEPTICPTSLVAHVLAGTAADGSTSRTSRATGWTGNAHKADVPQGGYAFRMNLDCGVPPCDSCSITGATTDGDGAAFVRCRNDLSQPCDVPFGIDPDCPGIGDCDVFISPPIPKVHADMRVTYVERLETDYSGSFDNESGAIQLNASGSDNVYTGINLVQPSPLCVGDPTPNDGQKDGTCVGGPNDPFACDAQGQHGTFGITSLDCPPDPLARISGLGLHRGVELTTGASTLASELQCQTPFSAFGCPCALCSGNLTLACRNDAECAAAGAGECSAGRQSQPNGCSDLVCTATVGSPPGRGECLAGPVSKFCDGFTRIDGSGIRGCTSDSDCDFFTGTDSCPSNDCGNCTLEEGRSCFLDPIAVAGAADPDNPLLVNAGCDRPLPPFFSYNLLVGLVGPFSDQFDVLYERLYQ
jgi:hypothetical protein